METKSRRGAALWYMVELRVSMSMHPDDWKAEFVKLLSAPNLSAADVMSAFALKSANIPRSLFRYRSDDPRSLSNLREDIFWLTSPLAFNDPYDSAMTASASRIFHKSSRLFIEILKKDALALGLSKDEIEKIASAPDPISALTLEYWKKHPQSFPRDPHEIAAFINGHMQRSTKERTQESNQNIRSNLRVCCFSETNISNLMWSHYANSHKGFCIEYDFAVLSLRDHLRLWLFPVIYCKTRFDVTSYYEEAMSSGEGNFMFGILASLHKAPEWAYEQEWRLVLNMPGHEGGCRYPSPKPKAHI